MRYGGLYGDFYGEYPVLDLRQTRLSPGAVRLTWACSGTFYGAPYGLSYGRDPGITVQVYVNGSRVGSTTGDSYTVHIDPDTQNWIECIAIASHLASEDQAHVLLTDGGETAELVWPASASDDVASYRIYSNSGSGAVSYTTAYATVPAESGGEAATSYTYRTKRLASGTWIFGIRAVDDAGNAQTTPTLEASATITRYPEPPSGLGLTYTFATKKATLAWTAPTNWT